MLTVTQSNTGWFDWFIRSFPFDCREGLGFTVLQPSLSANPVVFGFLLHVFGSASQGVTVLH